MNKDKSVKNEYTSVNNEYISIENKRRLARNKYRLVNNKKRSARHKNRSARNKNKSVSNHDKFAQALQLTSSACAVVGGVLLAANIEKISKYGFVLLAMSSSQLLVASLIKKDVRMIIYSGSIFFFVDCFGVYRWIIQ
jgi:predicted RND superfamily exporter protein